MIDPNGVQPINTQPFPLEDFSGGKTDYYLGGPMNKAEEVDNLLIAKQGSIGKLYTRYGSEILDEDYYQIPAGAQRVGALVYHNSMLFYQSARKLYYVSSGWNTLQGPSSNDLFPSGITTTSVMSYSTWAGHLLVTSSELVGLVSKVYKDSGGTWRLRTAGMPALASNPTITAGTPGATFSYLYRYVYEYTYTVGTVTFVDQGPTTEVLYTANAAIAAGAPNTAAHTLIPALANGATLNYDTASASLRVRIYRTTDGGVNFFEVGSVANGTTTYNDTTTDATLVNAAPLYTEGGYPDNDPPPLCKVLHVVDDRCFYGHCKVGSETIPGRVYQSVPGDVDAVPAENYTDLGDDIVTLSSHKSVPVVLGAKTVQRLEGGYDELGGGALFPVVVSDVHGCVSQQSAVQTPLGIFWAGLDGFYWTDGYQSLRVTSGIRITYLDIISTATRKARIQGKYDSLENRVYWTAQYASTATEADALFVLDLNWGISDDMPVTTMSGGANFKPTAIEFVAGELMRGDSRGYTFRHASSLYTDPQVDTGTAPVNWSEATIIYNWVSCATHFGAPAHRKWVPSCSVVCKDETNLSLQIVSINDDGLRSAELKPIRHRGSLTWGDPDVYWGDPDIRWGGQGIIDHLRRVPAMSLRCSYKQAQLTNAWVAVISSDTIGSATVDSGALTVTLDDTSFDWPSNAVGYSIAFSTDSYVQEFEVSARTGDVLTILTAGGGPPSGSVDWVLRGYPKGEVLYLDTFTFNYAVFGQTQVKFRQNATGEVGASDD